MSSPPPNKRQKTSCKVDSNQNNNLSQSLSVNNLKITETNGVMTEVDEGLYSRQIYVLGTEGMCRMGHSDVLISGLDGLGVEIAKNVVLGGVRSVVLHDPNSITWNDLSSHFFATESDIGQPRADVCKDRLSELNSHVAVSVLHKPKLSPDDLKKFTVVILCQPSHNVCLEIGDICHSLNVKLIVAATCGVFGKLFCDFGENFTVLDATGNDPPYAFVQQIERSAEGLVTCLEEVRHGFQDGDYVTFSEVKGMTELNGCKPRKIRVTGPDAFFIGDTTQFGAYVSGGTCTLVKMPQNYSYKPYREAFIQPNFMPSDFGKLDRAWQLHMYFKALGDYLEQNAGSYPKSWNHNDALSFIIHVNRTHKELQHADAKVEEVDQHLASLFSSTCSGQCSPMQAVIGSFAAQEAMKACAGKFIPLDQWFYFDATECLPLSKLNESGATKLDELVVAEGDASPTGTRYDGQVAIFGRLFQQKLHALKYFLVGTGAIGCELLKNFALMGVGAGPGGKITVTDMDSIEKSNLNRQFLFRPWDISKMKSIVAGQAIKRMNPQVNIEAHENRVSPESEVVYDDAFFEGLDGVANALDNIESRTYVDRRCVYYRKPLLESGTLGTKGNVQVVIPYLTESYSSTQDPPEKSFAMCTLKNFPYLIEHTLMWARDLFEGQFVHQSHSVDTYLREPTAFLERTMRENGNQPLETLQTLKDNIINRRPKAFEDCVGWARLLFQDLYTNTIAQLLFNFPPDHITQTGTQFWSGTKRCPTPLEFNVNDSMHMEFIISAANLRAFIYNIPENRDQSAIASMVKSVPVPPFKPKTGLHIEVTDSEMQNRSGAPLADANHLSELHKLMTSYTNTDGLKVTTIEFEKDDDNNFNMDFITAASNLRAVSYGITPTDRLKSKQIAGNIIPAIATTTSFVAGLACLEMFKLVQGHTDVTLYKNAFLNLAEPFIAFYEPVQPPKLKYYDTEFSLWDRFEVSGPMTLQDLLDYFKKEHKLEVTMLSYDVSLLYTFILKQDKRQERLAMPLRKLVETITKRKLPPHVMALVFDLCCNDENGNDVDVPYVRYLLNKK